MHILYNLEVETRSLACAVVKLVITVTQRVPKICLHVPNRFISNFTKFFKDKISFHGYDICHWQVITTSDLISLYCICTQAEMLCTHCMVVHVSKFQSKFGCNLHGSKGKLMEGQI